jgi:hypothetical protein
VNAFFVRGEQLIAGTDGQAARPARAAPAQTVNNDPEGLYFRPGVRSDGMAMRPSGSPFHDTKDWGRFKGRFGF